MEIPTEFEAVDMPETTRPSGAAQGAQALILIAEDEPEIAEILAAYLARNGMRSVHAADGARALELHLAPKPDLVLLDIQMPQVNGWQVLSQIRQRGDTPVIMLTALDQDVDKLTGLRIGADDYVVKPFNPAEVVARVEAVLRRSQPREDREERRILRAPPFVIDFEQHEVVASIENTPTRFATKFGVSFARMTPLPSVVVRNVSRRSSIAGSVSGVGISSSSRM